MNHRTPISNLQPQVHPPAARTTNDSIDKLLRLSQSAICNLQSAIAHERTSTMSIEQNKAVVRRIYDQLINQEQPGVIDEVFAEDAIIHDPFMGTVNGRAAFNQLL